MATEVYIFILLLAIAVEYVGSRIWEGLKFRGKMMITCPETHAPEVVKVNVRRAALNAIANRQELELCECSRWPERAGCDQGCLEQIELDPEDHRVWSVAAQWYAGKSCVYCQKPIESLSHFDRSPALLDPGKITAEWDAIPAESLPEAFSMDQPVCWSCHITQTFLRERPEIVVHRPWQERGPMGEYLPHNSHPRSPKPSSAA